MLISFFLFSLVTLPKKITGFSFLCSSCTSIMSLFLLRKMDITRILDSTVGVHILSAIIGLGLSCLFKSACTERHCLSFEGPSLDQVHPEKSFTFGERCFRYELIPATCESGRETVKMGT